jgi:hypothetical protein
LLKPKLVNTKRMKKFKTLRRLKNPKRSRLRLLPLSKTLILTTQDSLRTQTQSCSDSKLEVMMMEREEERGENSVTENSILVKTEEKMADTEAEEEASANVKETAVSIVAQVTATKAAMKALVEEEEKMLQSQTICFLTKISQLCEKEV